MPVKDKISDDLKTAMKARDKDRVSGLRMMLSELKYAQAAVAMSVELPDDEAVKVISGYHKRLVKSLDDYPEGERRDAIRREIGLVEEYLPKKASADDVAKVVEGILSSAADRSFGALMKEAMAKLGSSADGRLVSQIIKDRLAKA